MNKKHPRPEKQWIMQSQSPKLYRQMVEQSLGLICLHDLDGVLLYVNPAATKALGYEPHEWAGRNLREFLAPAVRPLFDRYLDRIRQQPLDSGLLRLVTKSGEERIWTYRNVRYEEGGQPAYVIGHAQDITDLIRAKQALETHEERFRALIEHTSEMIVVIDGEGTVRYESPSVARVLGSSLGASLQPSDTALVHPEDLLTLADAAVDFVQRPGATQQLEARVRCYHGEWRVLEIKATNLLTEPAVQGIVLNARDISHRKRAEETLQRYTEHLEQEVLQRTAELRNREQLAATGRLAARIAHEINNPLASIQYAFLLIKDAVPSHHPHYVYVDRIDKEIARIARITHQMFDLYQPGKETPRHFCVVQVVADVVALTELSCRRQGVTMRAPLPSAPVHVVLPEGAVRQVLFNLLANAIEATTGGGEVKVTVEVRAASVEINISDHGPGIAPEIQPHIFEPFFTTKEGPLGRGMGLGLSISKDLVETMGGRLEFRNRTPDPGAMFIMTLPRNLHTGAETHD